MAPQPGYAPHRVSQENRADGCIILRATGKLGPVAEKTGIWLHHWAAQTPEAVFLAERSGAGWRCETYASTLQKVRALAAALLGRGLSADTPVMMLSGNGVDHGLLALAAHYIGVPTVPVAEQYALIPGAHARLCEVIDLVRPKMAFVDNAELYKEAIALPALSGVEIVASQCAGRGITGFKSLLLGDSGTNIDTANAQVGPDTVAKILMTSGSAGRPKGVLTTHKMMCTNQAQIAQALPFLGAKPPRIVDWLPWNHVFGGSHNFNMMLANGGSLYIDDGKPTKDAFARTLENLSLVTGTLAFNVPIGFSMLLGALQRDEPLRKRFFSGLDLVFYAGASLPQDVWRGFEAMAQAVQGHVPLMTTSWGLTETAPACLMQHQPVGCPGVVGVPLKGITAKLVPLGTERYEVRVKGPSITKGYFKDPAKTRENIDDEGYFITGDALRFVDIEKPELGLRFDGRLSDDFKLLSGTWVRATDIRADMLACLAPLVADIVVTGHDRAELGVLVFPAGGVAPQLVKNGAVHSPKLAAELASRLSTQAARHSGSSRRVSRALVLSEPPSLIAGEATAKGNLNFRKILSRRADLLARLYDDDDPAVIKIEGN